MSTNKPSVRLDAALLDRVEKTLKAAGLAATSSELDPANGVHVRFAGGDAATQIAAKDALVKDLNGGLADGTGNYIIALNNESTTPHWMQAINAKPMALGLDLRGGVHFLMQVDMKGALDRAAEYATPLTFARSCVRKRFNTVALTRRATRLPSSSMILPNEKKLQGKSAPAMPIC